LNTAQQFSNSLGVTALGTVFFTVAGSRLTHVEAAMQAVTAIDIGLVLAIVPLVVLGWPGPTRPVPSSGSS
jgi:hypothetical protein